MEISPDPVDPASPRTAAALIVLEIALSCAIICNALFLIGGRLDRMNRVSGIAEDDLVRVQITGIGKDDNADGAHHIRPGGAARRARGEGGQRQQPGAVYGNASWNTRSTWPRTRPMNAERDHLPGRGTTARDLGLNLVAGRDFSADDYVECDAINEPDSKLQPHTVIITRSVAEKLFPGQEPLGKQLYSWGDDPMHRGRRGRSPGRVRTSRAGRPRTNTRCCSRSARRTPSAATTCCAYRSVAPRRGAQGGGRGAGAQRSQPHHPQGRTRSSSCARTTTARTARWRGCWSAVCIALLVVTALGIVGLASFWVQQRTRQIGMRRALGATRGQILRYFQTENFLLATVGIVLGMVLAFGINQLLMEQVRTAAAAGDVPAGRRAGCCGLLGQIAVLGGRRAAARRRRWPPASADRRTRQPARAPYRLIAARCRSGPAPTVLVIDDNPRSRRRWSCCSRCTTSARCARRLARRRASRCCAREPVDLVIQDMNFQADTTSGEEGVALFRAIRERHPDLPVILLTAWTHLESAVDLVKAGAADYLAKPWDDRKLLATVNNLLELAEARRELRAAPRRRTPPARARWSATTTCAALVFADPASERADRAGLPGRALRRAGADHRAQRRRQGEDRRDRAGQLGGAGRPVRRAQLRRAAGAS